MSAGTAYSKRYAGGFADLPSQTTAIDQTFLNAVETALLQLLGQAPTADGQVAQWDFANTRFGPALILNKNVDPAAAIASSKIDFSGGNALTNSAIAGAAAIARSKLDFGSGLVNADIAAAAAIALSKLNIGGTVGQVVKGDASVALPGLYRKTTSKTVNTSIAATDLLNGEITIAAGVMGTTGMIRLTAWGDFLQNAAAAPPRWQLVFGGTTIFDTYTNGTVAANPTRSGWRMVVEISNLGVANAQLASIAGWVGLSGGSTAFGYTAFATGEGQYAGVVESGSTTNVAGYLVNGINTAAVDTTAAKALVLNVINGSASATYETKLLGAVVELI